MFLPRPCKIAFTGLLTLAVLSAGAIPAVARAASNAAVARAALARLAPSAADHVLFRGLAPRADGLDAFAVGPSGDRIAIAGTTPVAMLSGFRWYLENVAHGQISREGVNLPKTFPLPRTTVHIVTPYRYRYAYNFTVFGYSAPYWSWTQWQHELDMAALHGINLALTTVGQEAVWYDTFRDFGYSDAAVRSWIVLPAHQPWEWMSNMHSFGSAVPLELIQRRARLGRQIIDRMRELGIQPVVPGFNGEVPGDFVAHVAGARIVPQGEWCGFQRPDWLASSDGAYARVAADFYAHQTGRFGLIHAKAIDLLHEGGRSGGINLTAAGSGVASALATADPHYLWIIQGWQHNPRKAVVDGIDARHLLIIDLKGLDWNRNSAYWGRPWVRGFLSNMGGSMNLYGDVRDIAKLAALRSDSTTGDMLGSAQMDEALDRDPIVTELSSDLTWTRGSFDFDTWLSRFVRARYGVLDPDALAAWRGLVATAYAQWDSSGWGGNDSLFNVEPALDAAGSGNANSRLQYDSANLEAAWRALLRAGTRLDGVDTYRYDLVALTQQVIANRTRVLLPRIAGAYAMKNRLAARAETRRWFALLDADDALLRTRSEFMLGPWIASAQAYGANASERKQFAWDALSLITVWGLPSSSGIMDYANRSWSGLTSSYYRARWKIYFTSLDSALARGAKPSSIDWWTFGDRWDRAPHAFPVRPQGDPLSAARAVERILQS